MAHALGVRRQASIPSSDTWGKSLPPASVSPSLRQGKDDSPLQRALRSLEQSTTRGSGLVWFFNIAHF